MNFYIDVGNNGPDVSEDTKLTFSDNIFDLTFESVSFSKGEMDEVLPVWNIGTLEVGEEAMIDFEGILNETGEDITLTATISGSNFDPTSEDNVLVKIIEKSSHPGDFVIKTTDGVVAAIERSGIVPGTDVYVSPDGRIEGGQLEEVISWPEEDPDWYSGGKLWFPGQAYLTKVPDTLPAWVISTERMFSGCSRFNQDISGWDTSNVIYMGHMFNNCKAFNQDISGWDTSNVTNMNRMFSDCKAFNQDISGWDTSNVVDMNYMFFYCSNFNQDLSGWCVSNISSEPWGFATGVDSWTLPKPIWGTCPQGDSEGDDDPTPVEGFVIKTRDGVVAEIEGPGTVSGTGVSVDANGVIDGYNSLEEVVSWPEEKPVWLEGNNISFYGAEYLTKVPDTLPAWITDMSEMFYQCSSFNQDISGWDTSNVTNMADMFSYCSSFSQDISGWDTSNVTNMTGMFLGCSSFNQDLSGWDTGNVTDMSDMFSYCSIFNGDLSEWDTGNVTDMSDMFYGCSSFNQDLSEWDTGNVTSMATMFYGCSSFNQDISGWDVSNVTIMSAMLRECSSFNQDLSGWCVSKISSNPFGFSTGTTSWTLPKPVWGTCPQGDSGDDDPTPEGFVIKTTGGVVAEIEGPGQVQGTSITVHEGGSIDWKNQLAEVLSWPEDKPVWLAGSNLSFYNCASLTKVPDTLPAWFTVMSYTFYGCSSFNQDISGWDTSNVTGMFAMFEGCSNFNQDLSGWCVSNISSEPNRFSTGTTSWTLPKPIWGTCPQG